MLSLWKMIDPDTKLISQFHRVILLNFVVKFQFYFIFYFFADLYSAEGSLSSVEPKR